MWIIWDNNQIIYVKYFFRQCLFLFLFSLINLRLPPEGVWLCFRPPICLTLWIVNVIQKDLPFSLPSCNIFGGETEKSIWWGLLFLGITRKVNFVLLKSEKVIYTSGYGMKVLGHLSVGGKLIEYPWLSYFDLFPLKI